MRRLLFAALLVLGLGLPVLADTHLWTGTDGNWSTAGNWSPAGPPGAGDTIGFANANALPSGNYNAGPLVFGTVTYTSQVTGGTSLSALIGSGNTCTSLGISNTSGITGFGIDRDVATGATCNWASGTVTVSIAVTGTLQLSGGATLAISQSVATGVITLTGGSDLSIAATKTLTASVTAGNGSTLSASGATGTLAGTFTASAAGAVITWTNLAITGNIAAAGYTITHNGTGTLTVNAAATLDAGTATAGAFAVNITNAAGTVTISKLLTTGTVIFDAAGNITLPAAIQTGAWTVTTVATLTCAASPGTTVTAGGTVLGAAITTLTNPLNLTMTGTGNLSWALGDPKQITTLTASGTTTLNGTVFCRALAGTGDLVLGAQSLYFQGSSANFWTYAPTGTGMTSTTGRVYLLYYTDASLTNAMSINAGSANVRIYPYLNDVTLTVAGNFQTTGTLLLYSLSTSKGCALVVGGNFSAGVITLGDTTKNSVGTITLAATGTHAFTSLAVAGTSTAHVLNLAGKVTISGNLTLAGITANFGGARITAAGNVTISGADATSIANTGCDLFSDGAGRVLTIDYIGAVTPPLRAWCGSTDGGHNTAGSIEFHPTPPGGMNMMGMGACLNRRWLRNAA